MDDGSVGLARGLVPAVMAAVNYCMFVRIWLSSDLRERHRRLRWRGHWDPGELMVIGVTEMVYSDIKTVVY
jgi:hypothetical protein